MKNNKPCNCECCQESKMMRNIVDSLPERQAKWLTEFYEKHMNIALNDEYQRYILDGSWPSSVKILTASLKKAKEINK